MTDFMRVFEAKALAAALTAAGHSVSERTVQRWKAGDTRPKAQDVRAIRELIGAMIMDATKEPPPAWAGAMEDRIVSEVRANRATITEALAVTFADWADRIDRERREGNADAMPDGTGDQPPAAAEPEPEPAT